MDIQSVSKTGHLTKAFQANKEIPQETLNELFDFLQSSASSVNAQPWRFIVASKQEDKDKIGHSLNPFNAPKVTNASTCIIFCTMLDMPTEHLQKVHQKEIEDGRFPNDTVAENWHQMQNDFIRFRRDDLNDLKTWMEKQTYLAAGAFSIAAANLGVGICLMEGFDPKTIDNMFGLPEHRLTSTLLVTLGYRDEEKDFAFRLPKSRLSKEELFTFL